MIKKISKSYNPEKYENQIYQKWEKSDYFNPDKLKTNKKTKNYSIVMPPPNVTGILHMGHASMLAYQDILIRYHRMKGDRTLWVPGTDHAAIATQTKVEKELKKENKTRHDLGRKVFLKKIEKFAKNSHDIIKNQVKKMGSSCDWSREAYTLDETRHKTVNSVFKMMYDDGLIYQGEKIVNWCPRCQSTLADDEIEYNEKNAKLYTFKYDKNFPINISTTRPETKLGDTAIAVNPKDKRYKKFIGEKYDVNFCGILLKIKIVGDRKIDMNFGTGAIGVTPAHSLIDWDIAKKNNLPIKKVINEKGNIKKGFNKFSGLKINEVRKKIINELKNKKLLIKEEDIQNNLSVCYRCGEAIEPLPSNQWFIDVNKKIPKYKKSLKQLSIEAVKKGVFGKNKINIHPQRFEKIYFNWMNNLRDWCISRQIWFGHRIPVWYKGKEIYVGIDAPKEEDWKQDSDTLDTWFSSGLWTFSTLAQNPDQIKINNGKLEIKSKDFKNFHPNNIMETGYDILFFWIARMIIMTTYSVGDIPFKEVYLHGLVLDEKGKKMSKSKGNVLDPLKMCEQFGTDATRLSLIIGTTPGNDIKISLKKIKGERNFVNKLWNISRYITINKEIKSKNKKIFKLTLVDHWIIGKMTVLIKEVSSHLEKYEFSSACEKLRNFTWNDLADWYIEASKFENNQETKSKILNMLLEDLLKLWHPFTPFVTEKIWETIEKENLLIIEKWPRVDKYTKLTKNKNDNNSFELIKNIVKVIRNARREYNISPTKKINIIIYTHSKNKKTLINSQKKLIKKLRTGIENLEIKVKGNKFAKSLYINIDKTEIYIPLEGIIDIEKEKDKLKKELITIEKYSAGIRKKLTNENFIKNAPKEIIKKEREKFDLNKIKIEKIKRQLNHLK